MIEDKIIQICYDYWSINDDDKEELKRELIKNIKEDGVDGANVLIDWCLCEYDRAREIYAIKNNIPYDTLLEKIDDNCGNMDFMKKDIDFLEDLDKIWDIVNWLLDYRNNDINENQLKELIEEEL